MRSRQANRLVWWAPCFAALGGLIAFAAVAEAGGLVRAPAVGGVYIDAEGVVSSPPAEGSEALQATWQAGLQRTPAVLGDLAELRFVSLRKLDEAIAAAEAAGEGLPDEVRYLAGLLRIKHVLVYPPTAEAPGDIVIAGPAEGWRVDRLGNTVGVTTGRPVLMLDDLIVGLRSGEASNGAGISCSIDPTPEGLARAQRVQKQLRPNDGPMTAARRLEQALGRQVIRVEGVPASSRFARTLVAADFRMKRLAMGFEPSPVAGLPSYLEMVDTRASQGSTLPRWWLAADYMPLGRDADGLAWELRGVGVKCLSEQDLVDQTGKISRGAGKPDGQATAWAERFSDRFAELADSDSAFGQVRNVFDLAIVGALLQLEDLWTVAQISTPQLLAGFEPEQYSEPREVATQATFLKRGKRWVITASGGVQLHPWTIADRAEQRPALADLRTDNAAAGGDSWWWQ